jgi:hypothetical protein
MTGAIADVVPLEERAIRLDPMGPFGGGHYQRIGMAELFQSHLDQAVSLFEKARTAHAARQSEWVYQAIPGLPPLMRSKETAAGPRTH